MMKMLMGCVMMNRKVFLELLKINLLSVNPLSTKNQHNRYRKKGLKIDGSFYRRLFVSTIVLPMLITTIAYSPYILLLNFKDMPIYLDSIVLFWILMGAMFNFVGALEILYGGKDAETLAALPIKPTDILFSKVIMIFASLFPYILPTTIAFGAFSWYNGFGLPTSIVLVLFGFLTASFISFAISLVVVQIVARFTTATKYKNAISTIVSLFGSFLFIGYIFYFQMKTRENIKIEKGADGISIHSSTGLISEVMLSEHKILILLAMFLISLAILALIGMYVKKNYMSVLFKMEGKVSTNKKWTKGEAQDNNFEKGETRDAIVFKGNKKNKSITGLDSFLFKYNASLINDSTVLTSVTMMAILPIIMILSGSFSMIEDMGGMDAVSKQVRTMITPSFVVLASVAYSIFFSLLSSTGLATMIFSLEGHDYEQFLSMPIKKKKIFMSKLVFTTAFSMIVPTITAIIISILLKLGPILPILAIFFTSVMHIAMNFNGMCFDIKNLILDWTNITDLTNRTPKWKSIIILSACLFFTIVGAIFIAIIFLTFPLLTVAIVILIYLAMVAFLLIPNIKVYREYVK